MVLTMVDIAGVFSAQSRLQFLQGCVGGHSVRLVLPLGLIEKITAAPYAIVSIEQAEPPGKRMNEI